MKQQSEIANLPKFSMIVLLLSLLISTFYFFVSISQQDIHYDDYNMNIESNVQKPHGEAIDDVKCIKNTFSLHMWTKFGDDWSETATCIAGNVTISFKHEYRRHNST